MLTLHYTTNLGEMFRPWFEEFNIKSVIMTKYYTIVDFDIALINSEQVEAVFLEALLNSDYSPLVGVVELTWEEAHLVNSDTKVDKAYIEIRMDELGDIKMHRNAPTLLNLLFAL